MNYNFEIHQVECKKSAFYWFISRETPTCPSLLNCDLKVDLILDLDFLQCFPIKQYLHFSKRIPVFLNTLSVQLGEQ